MNPTLTSWPSEHLASPQADPAPIRILLVEDDEDDHILIRDTLEEMGTPTCFLEWARTYEAGLQLIHEHRHDLYVFDYRLGAHTGIDLLRAGKASDPYITILLLTGSGGELVAAEALRLGAADYMPKSLLSTKSLHRAIMNTLEKAQLRRALAEHQQHVEHTNQILTKQNQEIQRFYHTLAHELKTPLTAAREFTAIMLDGLGGPLTSEQKEYLHLSQDCLGQITNQVNDLLDITRLDTGKLSIHQQPEDLSLLISRVVAAMNATAQHKSLTISVSSQLDTPTVWIDQSRITQALTNLLSNAIKFTPPGGTITVETSDNPEDPSSVCVSVRDTGCGIAPEHLEHIFDRLYQVEEGHARVTGGLGLGLTITEEIMKLHGGRIAVHSQRGHGTQFTITIPKEGAEVIHPLRTQGESREIKNSAC